MEECLYAYEQSVSNMAYKSQRKDSVRVVHMGQLFPKVTEEIVALMIELI